MIYIDTSCLFKIFHPEPLSRDVIEAVAAETDVVVSVLAEIETMVQFKAMWTGGSVSRPEWRRQEAELARLRNQPPFKFCNLHATIFQTALRQHRNSADWHCRSLDRLHLAAMEELDISRLMTHDEAQGRAAEAAGFSVLRPGRK